VQFSEAFEDRFIRQGEYEDRSIEETLTIGWDLLRILPRAELKRVKEEHIRKYMENTG
jgi:V/A-type H+-transporting ATPase subunit B